MTQNYDMGLFSIIGLTTIYIWNCVVLTLLAEPKTSRRKCAVVITASMAASFLLLYLLAFVLKVAVAMSIVVISVLTFIESIVIFCAVSQGSVPKKIFLCINYSNYFCISTQLGNLAANFIFGVNDPRYQLTSIIIRNTINLIVVPVYFKFIHPKFRGLKISRNREWWSLCLVSILFMATYLVQSISVPYTMDKFPQFFPVMIMVYAQGFVSFVMIFHTISYMNKTAETELMKKNTIFLKEQIERLSQSEHRVRQIRHDMRHHLTNIAEHIQKGDNAEALEYLKNCGADLDMASAKRFCQNATLDNIISAYSSRAERLNIPFSCKAKVGGDLRINDTDLVAILANLLENALNEAQKSSILEPKIEVFISDEDNRLVMIVNNSCEEMELSGKFPKSRGIGISSVIFAVEKYGGSIDYTVESGVCSVCAAFGISGGEMLTAGKEF